jgi:hypothetical protein
MEAYRAQRRLIAELSIESKALGFHGAFCIGALSGGEQGAGP